MSVSNLLKYALIADAIASGTMGLLLAGGAGVLSSFLNLPQPLLLYTGLFLLPYAAFVAWTGTRRDIPRPMAWLIVALNVVWVIDSFALPFTGLVSPNGWGVAFIVAQGLAVATFAGLQIIGLKQMRGLA